MVIIVTGTPGTGKTTFAKKYAKDYDLQYIDVNQVIKDNNLIEEHDKILDTDIIDSNKLNIVLIKLIKENKNVIIDSHLSHYLPKKYVDKCFVTKCELSELKKRLKARGYSEKKIRDNLDAEIFDTCRIEAQELGHNLDVINT